MKMFGTNGIRGIVNEYMSCELALGIGRSVGTVLGKKVAVAMDTRVSSVMVKSALCSGLASVGADVFDLGMVPTPALQYYVKTHGDIDCGVMITASHNPPEFNGIKCISGDGTECTPEEEKAIEDTYESEIGCVPWNGIGRMMTVNDAGERYVDSIVSKVDAELIRNAKLTVCVDCANGASVTTTPMLLSKLGVRAITINGNPQGEFPGHPSEPTEENLELLKKIVLDSNADMGVAHDGDADRCVFIADDGRFLSGDLSLAILGKYILKRNAGGKIVVTVATSSIVEKVARDSGGSVEYTAVGSPIVARAMASDEGIFGGEENGGLIFADHQYCRDGAMGLAMMLECLARDGPLSQQADSLPRYHTIKAAIKCPDGLKDELIRSISEAHSSDRCNLTDGLRIDYDDGWILMRPSGTEPKFRIYSESKDPDTASRRSKEFIEEAERTMKEISRASETASPSSA